MALPEEIAPLAQYILKQEKTGASMTSLLSLVKKIDIEEAGHFVSEALSAYNQSKK